jgi:hypothetical protein
MGRTPGGNRIATVCGLLAGKSQSGNIETFNFSLGQEVRDLSEAELTDYLNAVLALNKEDIPLLSYVTSGTLDLGKVAVGVTTDLTAHGTLFDTIKHGDASYTWRGSAWTAAS